MARKLRKRRRSGFYRGFKKTSIPGDSGYVKPRKDGGRYHKFYPNGRVHIDKYDPKRSPIQHVVVDFLTGKKKRR